MDRKLVFGGLLFLSIFLYTGCGSNEQEKYDIYLLIGQSNMAGRAFAEGIDEDTLQNVLLYKGIEGQPWEKAANPLNKYSTVRKEMGMQRLGPGYTFARKTAEMNPGRTIALVVNAKGGTSLKEWAPGGKLYTEAVNRANAAAEWGTVKGILWHQGEGDANKADTYVDSLAVFVQSLRKDLGNDKIPFVAGQIYPRSATYAQFNEAILRIPDVIPNSAVVTSEGTSSFDNLHFDAASQRKMGERYAEKMGQLVKP